MPGMRRLLLGRSFAFEMTIERLGIYPVSRNFRGSGLKARNFLVTPPRNSKYSRGLARNFLDVKSRYPIFSRRLVNRFENQGPFPRPPKKGGRGGRGGGGGGGVGGGREGVAFWIVFGSGKLEVEIVL